MKHRLQRLRNIPASTTFKFCLTGKGTLRFQNKKCHCRFEFDWNSGQGAILRCWPRSVHFPHVVPFGSSAQLEGRITDGPWAKWLLNAKALSYSGSKKAYGEKSSLMLTFGVPPKAAVILERDSTKQSADVFAYWIPNFFFRPLTQTSRFRNRTAADGFTFRSLGHEFTFRQVADYKNVQERCTVRKLFAAITTVVQIQGPLDTSSHEESAAIECLFSLVSGMSGAWCSPVARAEYANRNLIRVIFPCRSAAPHHSHRSLMDNWRVEHGWPRFLEKTLPAFTSLAEPLKLRSVCRQMVEAQSDLTLQSCMAIRLMSLEQLATRYLDHIGCSIPDAPLESKLNRANKTLQCLSKRFRRSLPDIRQKLRNPLFHQGAFDENDFETMCRCELDLLNAAGLILSAICGYTGPLQLQDYDKGEFVRTVTEVGKA